MRKQYIKKCPSCGQLFAFENCSHCKDNDVKCWCKKCYPKNTTKMCGEEVELKERQVFIFR